MIILNRFIASSLRFEVFSVRFIFIIVENGWHGGQIENISGRLSYPFRIDCNSDTKFRPPFWSPFFWISYLRYLGMPPSYLFLLFLRSVYVNSHQSSISIPARTWIPALINPLVTPPAPQKNRLLQLLVTFFDKV